MCYIEIKVFFKMSYNCSLKSRLILTFKSRINFMSCPKIKVVFKMSQNPPFLTALSNHILCVQPECITLVFRDYL